VTFANEPRTYKEASNGPHSKEWEKAIDTEYRTLQITGTFEWVPKLPEGRKSIGSRIIFRLKRDGNGNITKYKARIVARGFSQIPGQDFTDTFSSVAKFTTLRTLLSTIAHKRWELHQVDVVAAYLRGDLDEELYLEVPVGVNKPEKKGWYWRLKKPLYGVKQAGWQWKAKLDDIMRPLGFEKSQADDCLYILREKGEIVMLVLMYVDDMAVTGKSIEKVQGFKTALSHEFEISDLGELKYILGIQIMRNREVRTISMNQTAYIHQILARFGMSECAPISTPLTVKHNLSTSQSPKTEEEVTKYLEYSNDLHYLEIVGALLYATQTCPDIQYAIGVKTH